MNKHPLMFQYRECVPSSLARRAILWERLQAALSSYLICMLYAGTGGHRLPAAPLHLQ